MSLKSQANSSIFQEHQQLINSAGGAAKQNLPVSIGGGKSDKRLSALRQFATDQLCKLSLSKPHP